MLGYVVGPKTSTRRLLTGYLCMVLIPVVALLGIMRCGSSLRAPGASTGILNLEPKGSSGPQDLFLVILQIAVILVAARVVGGLFRFVGQPRVVGEMAAGIILGPSVFGW